MINQTPKISVLMSVYNGEKYLRQAIDSILKQTLTDFEFIIINDASTDNTLKIIKSYQDSRIKIINNQKNLGLTKSLNLGLKQARGEYIARMDADDVSFPNRLKEQYNFLEKHPEFVLIGNWVELIDKNGKIIDYKKKATDFNIIKFKILLGNPFIHPSIFFRRRIIVDLGGYNEKYLYAQDYELYSRLIKKYKITNLPKILLKYRCLNESITGTSQKRKIQLDNALKINFNNINHYVNLKRTDTEIFINTINKRVLNLMAILKSLKIYKKLLKAFIKKENLNKKQIQKIYSIYKTNKEMLIGWYLKNKFPLFYKLLKFFIPR